MKLAMKNRRARLAAVALLLSTLLFAIVPASDSNRTDTARFPFEPTEELVYEGEFTRAILRGINIAELRFNVNQTQFSSKTQTKGGAQPALRFTVEVES